MWWPGSQAADAHAALETVSGRWVPEALDGQRYWFAPSLAAPQALASPTAYLLPAFDEYLLGYRGPSAALAAVHANKVVPGGNGVFKPIIAVDGRIVSTWKCTVRKTKVLVTLHPSPRSTRPRKRL